MKGDDRFSLEYIQNLGCSSSKSQANTRQSTERQTECEKTKRNSDKIRIPRKMSPVAYTRFYRPPEVILG